MGSCVLKYSNADPVMLREKKHSDNIDKHLRRQRTISLSQQAHRHSILLLGATNSGKTTIFEQLAMIHPEGEVVSQNSSDQEHDDHYHDHNVHPNVIDAKYIRHYTVVQMQYLVQSCLTEFKQTLTKNSDTDHALDWITLQTQKSNTDNNKNSNVLIDDSNYIKQENIDLEFDNFKFKRAKTNFVLGTDIFSDEINENISLLWKDNAIKDTFQKRDECKNGFKIMDNSEYFFENIDRITKDDYVPSEEDILLMHKPTIGIEKLEYPIDRGKNILEVIDVGGATTERRKWLQHFDNVKAVIYVASLSSYNQFIYDKNSEIEEFETKPKINALLESLEIFDTILNSYDYRTRLNIEEKAVVLFFNKTDVFKQKLKKYPLTTCFKEYDGQNTFKQCCNYVAKQFESKDKNPRPDHTFYTHFTCATDRNNIATVFSDVQHITVVKCLCKGGLI